MSFPFCITAELPPEFNWRNGLHGEHGANGIDRSHDRSFVTHAHLHHPDDEEQRDVAWIQVRERKGLVKSYI